MPVVELILETAVSVSSAAPVPPRVLSSVAGAVELVAIVDAIAVVVMVAAVMVVAELVDIDFGVVESHPLHVLSHLPSTPSHKPCIKIL